MLRNSKRRFGAVAILILIAIALDQRRPPSAQWSTAAAVGGIHLYQATLSPIYAQMGVRCRFTPTCSHYAAAVVAKDGALVGNARAVWRILRCAPWTKAGTVDPP